MSRKQSLLVFGIVTALSPFLGLPYSWLMVLLPVLGLLVILTAYLVRKPSVTLEPVTTPHETEGAY